MSSPEEESRRIGLVSERFRFCSHDQPFLLPPSLQDWLPENHLARFIADVMNELDLSSIYASYERSDGRGLAAYHPVLMARLLLYGLLHRDHEFPQDRAGNLRQRSISLFVGRPTSRSRYPGCLSSGTCEGAGRVICTSPETMSESWLGEVG